MAFQKVSLSKTFHKYTQTEPGTVLVNEGVYLGTEEGKYGIEHLFKSPNGGIIVLNKAGGLCKKLEKFASIGQKVSVTFQGKKLIPSGRFAGKECYDFDVSVDDSFTPTATTTVASTDGDITL